MVEHLMQTIIASGYFETSPSMEQLYAVCEKLVGENPDGCVYFHRETFNPGQIAGELTLNRMTEGFALRQNHETLEGAMSELCDMVCQSPV